MLDGLDEDIDVTQAHITPTHLLGNLAYAADDIQVPAGWNGRGCVSKSTLG